MLCHINFILSKQGLTIILSSNIGGSSQILNSPNGLYLNHVTFNNRTDDSVFIKFH